MKLILEASQKGSQGSPWGVIHPPPLKPLGIHPKGKSKHRCEEQQKVLSGSDSPHSLEWPIRPASSPALPPLSHNGLLASSHSHYMYLSFCVFAHTMLSPWMLKKKKKKPYFKAKYKFHFLQWVICCPSQTELNHSSSIPFSMLYTWHWTYLFTCLYLLSKAPSTTTTLPPRPRVISCAFFIIIVWLCILCIWAF